jgi:hypothetical protein
MVYPIRGSSVIESPEPATRRLAMTIEDDTGGKLAAVIKKAMEDLVITTSEYEEIMAQAAEDGVIDAEEAKLLGELNAMIADGTLKRVPG